MKRESLKKLALASILALGISIPSCVDLGMEEDPEPAITDTNTTETIEPTETYLAYEASIHLVDPATLEEIPISSEEIINYSILPDITNINLDTLTYEDLYTKELIFVAGADLSNNIIKIFKVPLVKGETPTISQVSNLSNACKIYNTIGGDLTNDLIYFTVFTAGSDGECWTSDDELVFVNSKMDENTSPIPLKDIGSIIGKYSGTSPLEIAGFYVLSPNSELKKCDTQLSNCEVLSSVPSTGFFHVRDALRRETYFCINGEIYTIKDGDNNLVNTKASCFENLEPSYIGSTITQDKNSIYFITFNQSVSDYIVMKYNKDEQGTITLGSVYGDLGLSVNLTYTPETVPIFYGNTVNKLIIKDNYENKLIAMDKSSGEITEIKTFSWSDQIKEKKIYKDYILFNYRNDQGKYACFWKEGMSEAQCEENAMLMGILYNNFGTLSFDFLDEINEDPELEIYKFLAVKNDREIYVIDPNDITNQTLLGTLPEGYMVDEFFYGLGNKLLISALNTNLASPLRDIFYIDVDNNTIKQLTNTEKIDEIVIDF